MSAKTQTVLDLEDRRAEQRTKLQRAQGATSWSKVLEEIQALVRTLTPKEAVYLLDTSDTALADALAERTDREGRKRRLPLPQSFVWHAEWLLMLLVAAPQADRDRLFGVLARELGYKAPERAKKLSEAEELRIWKRAVGRLAPGIESAIAAEIEDAT